MIENMFQILFWIFSYIILILVVSIVAKKRGVSILIGLYTALLISSFVVVNKIGIFLGVETTVAVIVYGLTFLITDIISEFYGKKYARLALITGLLSLCGFYLTLFVSLAWTYPIYWTGQTAFEEVFETSYRIFFAGVLSLLVAIFQDVTIYHYLKDKTKGKYLWLRNMTSTTISQLFDNVIFFFIAFYGIWSTSSIIAAIIGVTFIIRPLLVVLDTPVMYILRAYYKDS